MKNKQPAKEPAAEATQYCMEIILGLAAFRLHLFPCLNWDWLEPGAS